MKKLIVILLLILSLCIPVSASQVSGMQGNFVLDTDGSCQVSLSVTLQLDTAPGELVFPLPAQAADVRFNGGSVQTRLENTRLAVLLPHSGAGNYSFTLSYKLPQTVRELEETESLLLELPILSGFGYPVEALSFTVTLPGENQAEPYFYSDYHQDNIDRYLQITAEGSTVSGRLTQGLKDHESLVMTLETSVQMFPHRNQEKPIVDGWDIAVIVLVALAALYYFITLLPVVPRRVRCYTAPEGISAGEVGTCLTGSGPELTLMVIGWAQLGYLQIELSGRHVRLHKRMEMGNERSAFEMRIFQSLFKERNTISDSSYRYAQLCRKVAVKSPLLHQLFKPSSGNPKIFRLLAGLAGAISGLQLGLAVQAGRGVQITLAVVFCILCASFSYFIQAGGKCIPLRDKSPMYLSVGCMLLWIALGVLLDEVVLTLPMVLFQFVCGLGAAYGGRRSERGKRCLAELMSLRQYMTSAPGPELQRMLQGNPNYFYELVPYALAMGVDKSFAKRFGKEPLPDQSFLIAGRSREMNASEVADCLRRVADSLNALQKKLPYQQLTGRK